MKIFIFRHLPCIYIGKALISWWSTANYCAFLFFKFCICVLDPCAVVRWHHCVYSLKVCFLLVHRSQLVPISNAHFFSRRVIYSSQYFCTLVSFCPVIPHILSAHISGGKFISILEEIWRKKYVFTVTEGWPNLLLEYFILKEFGIVNFSIRNSFGKFIIALSQRWSESPSKHLSYNVKSFDIWMESYPNI